MCVTGGKANQANRLALCKAVKHRFISNRIYICHMKWTDEFEPTSQINGNIEITFNKKNKEFDMYEPIPEQLVLTVGKTGRANRLTFDAPTSEELLETARVFREIGKQLQELEKEIEADEEDIEENSLDHLMNEERIEVRETIPRSGEGIEESEIVDQTNFSEQKVSDILTRMKKDGQIYEAKEGVMKRV